MGMQALQLSDEKKKDNIKQTCLDVQKLRGALGANCDGANNRDQCMGLVGMGHKLNGTSISDYTPGKRCKIGGKGVLTLASEVDTYTKNYCQIDTAHATCASLKKPSEDAGTPPTAPPPAAQEAVGKVAETTQDASGGAALLSSVSSLSCCMFAIMGAMTMFRR